MRLEETGSLYILDEEIPIDPIERRKAKSKVAHFVVIGDELYKKSLHEGSPLRICISEEEEGHSVLQSIHSGRGGAQQGSRKLASRIKRQGTTSWHYIR